MTRSRRARLRLIAAAATVALSLAGCTEEDRGQVQDELEEEADQGREKAEEFQRSEDGQQVRDKIDQGRRRVEQEVDDKTDELEQDQGR